MGTRRTKAAKTSLDQPPEGLWALRVRNISRIAVAMPKQDRKEEIVLSPQQEVVLSSDWVRERTLRTFVEQGRIEVEWVAPTYVPRSLPSLDLAPEECQPETNSDRAFALEIALGNADDALKAIGVEVGKPDGTGVDIRFMKGRMFRVLKAAQWLEARLQKRPAVLKALKARLEQIHLM